MAESRTSTHTFKEVDGLSLAIDVSKPQSSNNGVALLHFHGGYLVLGEKTTSPPHWLINACHARGWTYATPSYRLLPEAKGSDILSDALDAIHWVQQNISDRIVIAGSSAGGYLALAAAAHPTCPRPLAVLSIYGMLDPASQTYVQPGKPLRAPVEDLPKVREELKEAMQSGKVIDGYPFPADPATDRRFGWIKALHEAALYPDVLTQVPGLASRIAAQGVEAIPDECRSLFPVSFRLRSDFPPTVLLHGDADILVQFEQSAAVAEKMASLGIDVHLERAEGQGHGFEHKSVIDLDSGDTGGEDPGMIACLRHVIAAVERACR
ncbi:Alpha/Beta hydrolase protein [Aspergillus aurantiobrunneus]